MAARREQRYRAGMTDIVVRKVKFTFPDDLDDVLPGNDLLQESYLVAFSLTMPYLEPYLIRTYRSVLSRITDEALADDMRAFIAQEAQHFQNHRRVNEIIRAQLGNEVGAKLRAIEDRLDADYQRFTKEASDRFNLVYAEGFEAMTCAMALTMFEQAASGASGMFTRFGPWQQLWAWHAAEEVEHRTVAFDVYEHLAGSWLRRVVGSLRAQWHFHRIVVQLQKVVLASQGSTKRPGLPGWLRQGWRRYLRTFSPRYHPGTIVPNPMLATILAGFTPADLADPAAPAD